MSIANGFVFGNQSAKDERMIQFASGFLMNFRKDGLISSGADAKVDVSRSNGRSSRQRKCPSKFSPPDIRSPKKTRRSTGDGFAKPKGVTGTGDKMKSPVEQRKDTPRPKVQKGKKRQSVFGSKDQEKE